jgi:hemerythrin
MPLGWDRSLETGNEQIDAQHRELFARLDALGEATREHRGPEELGRLLGFLADYVDTHFEDEEALMARSGYARLEEHRAEHEAFRLERDALLREFLSHGPTAVLVVKASDRITAWLREHVQRADRAFVAFLGSPPRAG